MTTLGNCHHDFPRLATQSGFSFQLHSGKVNWSEIENLDLNDITEKRNFQLLERNLINVINCNLEKEYDLKILNQNFVKLFKLAQLGVDYLSYCEAYLDKCVIILQEQLLALQEECKSLKNEKERKKEEGSQSKRKGKTQSYQCEKCEKAFISDVYLKFHDKRRHSSPNTPKSANPSPKTRLDNSQQTEHQPKATASTQTASDSPTAAHSEELTDNIKTHHAAKIENLEQEIQQLKERLRRAENVLSDKPEPPKPSGCSPFPGSVCHNTMLLLLPPQQTQQEGNPGYLAPAPEVLHPNCSLIHVPVNPKTVESKPPPESTQTFESKEINSQTEAKSDVAVKVVENVERLRKDASEVLECDKENIDPNCEEIAVKLSKPLPPPRKPKRSIPTRLVAESPKMAEESGREVMKSTPVKQSPVQSHPVFEFSESISDIHQRQSTSSESLNSRKNDAAGDRPRSLLEAIVRRRSPKFQVFRRSLRRSLSSLCESVTSTGRESMSEDPAKAAVVEGLNGRLRELGVDPEWSGIPKRTMKQKLKILKQRRKLLTKENPMYPLIRQNIEEKILQRLRKNLGGKKTNLTENLSQESVRTEEAAAPSLTEESAKPRMYDIESDSDSKSSDSEVRLVELAQQKGSPKALDSEAIERDFDLSVFQVGRGRPSKARERESPVKVEDFPTDSDTDFSCGKDSKDLSGRADEVAEGEGLPIPREGQSILKRQVPVASRPPQRSSPSQQAFSTEGVQGKLQLNAKKKVWFGNSSNDLDGLSDSPADDWSLRSDWEKD